MMRNLQIILLLITVCPVFGQSDTWSAYKSEYLDPYMSLDIAPIRLAYLDNFQDIKEKEELDKQLIFFERMQNDLSTIEHESLGPDQRVEYEYFKYIIELNKDRLALELKWATKRPDTIPSGGMHQLNDHKDWYVYYLKRWLDRSVNVDSIYAFGHSEIKRAEDKIKQIRIRSGKDLEEHMRFLRSSAFLITDADSVQKLFEGYHRWITPKLKNYFPGVNEIPALKIQRGQNPNLAKVPGYYSNNTFYYNLFENPFNKRQAAFLYLHEGLPGHHYEVTHRRLIDHKEITSLMNLPGYGEGWAAYVEEIAYELGLYQNIYDQLGRWEWDLIRSVRVVLDIGLNYHGWGDEEALNFWMQHISDKEDVGKREIARMRRWPVQVITYKYGASRILEWKNNLEKKPDFELMEFHEKILGFGPLPYSVLEQYVLNNYNNE